jgi:hypothetical protein
MGYPMTNPALQEYYDLLAKSQKFHDWGTPSEKIRPKNPAVSVGEKHFTPQELAEAWGVSFPCVALTCLMKSQKSSSEFYFNVCTISVRDF